MKCLNVKDATAENFVKAIEAKVYRALRQGKNGLLLMQQMIRLIFIIIKGKVDAKD